MRIPALIAAILLAGTAHAQTISPMTGSSPTVPAQPPAVTAPPSGAPAAAAAPHRRRRTLKQRFEAANTTKDGHLTLDQAKAGHMAAIARDFAAIDKDRKGYVTMDDIQAHNRAVRAARKAARSAG